MTKLFKLITHNLLLITVLFSFHCSAQWQQTSCPTENIVYSLATSGENIFAGTHGSGLYLSTNNGYSWTSDGLTTGYVVLSLTKSDSNMFAGTNYGVYLSSDNGTSWIAMNNGLLLSQDVISLVVSGDTIFAGTQGNGVFLSTNNGVSWVAVNNGLTDAIVCSLAVNGKNIFAGTGWGGGIFLSTNNGASWNAMNNGCKFIHCLAISEGNIFAGTDSGGVFISTNNGASWSAINNGLTDSCIISLTISETNIFAGTWGGVFLSTNNGTSWTNVSNGLTDTYVHSLAIGGGYIFAGTDEAGVWKRALSEMLGINELKSTNYELQTEIYPNPVNQSSYISYQLSEKSNLKLTIFDITGREMTTLLDETKDKGDYKINFNTQNLNQGLYFLKASTNTAVRVTKFIKE